MEVDEYITMADKIGEDNNNDIFSAVVERYRGYIEGEAETDEEDKGDKELRITDSEALKAVEILKSYEIQQEDGLEVVLRALDRIDKRISTKRVKLRKQQTIESFFI